MIDGMNSDATLAMMKLSNAELSPAKFASKDQKKIETAAREFEAVFISEMMKPMYEGLETDGMFGGGQAEKIFRSVMLQEYGKIMSQTGRVGIAPHIQEEMIKLQEQQAQPLQTEG